MGEAKGLIITVLITLAILVGGIFLLSKGGNSPQKPVIVSSDLLIHPDSHQTASGSAKVVLVEFGDYQCPACGIAYPTVKQILKDYGNEINLVFRNFPLPQHKISQISAEAAEAANVQGKFWPMHDKLYETQNDWGDSDKPLDKFLVYAKDLGLDVNKFKADVTSNKYQDLIQRDITDGNNIGVNATPSFFVNGQAMNGIPTYDDFKAALDPILGKK